LLMGARGWWRRLALLAFVTGCLALVFTLTRGGWLAAGLSVSLFCLLTLRRKSLFLWVGVGVTASGILVFALLHETIVTRLSDEGAATIIDAAAPPPRSERAPGEQADAFAGVEDYEAVSPTRAGSGRISRSARLRAMQMKRKKSHVIWTVMLFFTTIFVVWPGPFLFNTIRNVTPQYAVDMAEKFRGMGDWFMSIFAS